MSYGMDTEQTRSCFEELDVTTQSDVKPLGFVPDHSMRGVGDNSIGGDDVHGSTTTFPRMRLSNRYTTSYGCHDLVEHVNCH
jgi:hypothetical protein